MFESPFPPHLLVFIIVRTVCVPGCNNAVVWKTCARRNRPLSETLSCTPMLKERTMNREHIKGAADKAKGAMKDTAGKLTGNKKMQAEGKLDKSRGAAHNVGGDVKDAAHDVTKHHGDR